LRAGAPKVYNALENYMVKSGGMIPLEAYHGTPHKIEGAFDIKKVGTGEGAQAYGHGMYFAENPAVAEGYQTALSRKSPEAVKYMNELSKDADRASQVAATALQNFDNSKQAIDELKASLKNKNTPKEYIPIYEAAIKKLELTPVSGNLYKVDIPDKDIPNMLDWDKPLNQQSDVVKKALGLPEDKFAGFKIPATGTNYSFSQNWRGEDLYKALTDLSKTQAGASEVLNSMGVKGIRYLDEGSRGNYRAQTTYKGQPYSDMLSFKTKGQLDDFIKEKEAEGFGVKTFPQTSNFVVFEPSTVKILEKNKKKVEGLLD